jgi:hypothetical protein
LRETQRTIDPRLRVLFVLGVAAGVFFLREPWQAGAACALLAITWLIVKLPPKRLARQILKLWGFALFILASYAFFNDEGGFSTTPNLDGLREGGLMLLRVLALILASQIARAGDARAIASGLRKLGVPQSASIAIDTVLALLGGEGGGGGGRGDGSGGGRGQREDAPREGFWAAVRRMAKGDVGPIVNRLRRHIDRAESHIEQSHMSEVDRVRIKDIAVIAGVSLTMLGIKALKILPGIPFAPGNKLVVLTPLYIAATLLTKTRFGGTLTGATMGTVAFLLGDGKYGPFEILKHITPGVLSDLFVPPMTRQGRMPGPIAWCFLGGMIGAGRFVTIFAIVFFVQAPAAAYAILIPGLTIHTTFGVASGYVTYQVARAISGMK